MLSTLLKLLYPLGAPPDPKKAFKEEWEAIEILNHKWALEDIR